MRVVSKRYVSRETHCLRASIGPNHAKQQQRRSALASAPAYLGNAHLRIKAEYAYVQPHRWLACVMRWRARRRASVGGRQNSGCGMPHHRYHWVWFVLGLGSSITRDRASRSNVSREISAILGASRFKEGTCWWTSRGSHVGSSSSIRPARYRPRTASSCRVVCEIVSRETLLDFRELPRVTPEYPPASPEFRG